MWHWFDDLALTRRRSHHCPVLVRHRTDEHHRGIDHSAMVSWRARQQADLFWRDLVGPGGDDRWAFEDIAEGRRKGGVPRELPTLTKAIADGTALFELLPWYADWQDRADANKNMYGWFWMFSDALMWEAPKSGKWASWAGTKVAHPLPRRPFGGVRIADRTRLVRLPCTGKEATAAADLLKFTQADLIASGGADFGQPDSNDRKLPSLLPTAELYDRTFLQADVRITAQPVPISDPSNLDKDAFAYAAAVNQAFAKAPTTVPGGTRNSLGTPGKIWAIADGMDTWVCCRDKNFRKWEFACINHGFHKKIAWVNNKPIVHLWQNRGGCHPWTHEDYSQIFTLVAGWCWVKGLHDSAPGWKKTADVYLDKVLCKLVRDNGRPVPALRYHGNKTPEPKTPCP